MKYITIITRIKTLYLSCSGDGKVWQSSDNGLHNKYSKKYDETQL